MSGFRWAALGLAVLLSLSFFSRVPPMEGNVKGNAGDVEAVKEESVKEELQGGYAELQDDLEVTDDLLITGTIVAVTLIGAGLIYWSERESRVAEGIASVGKSLVSGFVGEQKCISCVFVVYSVFAMESIATQGVRILTPLVLLILVPMLVIWLIWKAVGIVLSAGSGGGQGEGWSAIREALPRIAVCLVVLGTAASVPNPAVVQETLYRVLVAPASEASLALGRRMASLSVPLTADSGNYYVNAAKTVQDMNSPLVRNPSAPSRRAANVAVGMSVDMHTASVLGAATSVGMIAASSQLSFFQALFGMLLGFITLMMFMVLIVMAGMRLVGPFLQIGLVCAVSPVLVAMWCFRSTQRFAASGVKIVLASLLYIILLGVGFACVTDLIMLTASGQGVKQRVSGDGASCTGPVNENDRITKESIHCAIGATMSGLIEYDEEDEPQLVNATYPFLNLIAAFMAMTILAKVQEVASAVVGSQQIQNVGDQVAGQMTSMVQKSAVGAVGLGMLALGPMARMGGAGMRALGGVLTGGAKSVFTKFGGR